MNQKSEGLRLPIGNKRVLVTMAAVIGAHGEPKVKPLFPEISAENRAERLTGLTSRLGLDDKKTSIGITAVSAERLAIEYGHDVVQELASKGKIQY